MISRGTISILCLAVLGLSACRDKPVVGFIGMLSGPSSELGVAGRDGARLFVEEEGFRLVACDTRGAPATASACVRALADSGARVVIGPMTSAEVDSAIAAASHADLLLVSPTVSAHTLQGKDDAFVRLIGSNLDQADTLASLLVRDKFRHILVVWEIANAAYTRAVADRIVERLGKSSMSDTVVSVGYRTGLDLSFDSIVSAHPGADALVISGSAMDAALLCRAVARAGSKARLFGSQFAMGYDLLRVGGKDAEGMAVAAAAPLADSTPQRKAFVRRFQARYQHPPPFGAFFAWEAAVASRVAWKAGGSEDARRWILSQPPLAPLGDTIPLDRFGDVHRRIVPHRVHDGRFEAIP